MMAELLQCCCDAADVPPSARISAFRSSISRANFVLRNVRRILRSTALTRVMRSLSSIMSPKTRNIGLLYLWSSRSMPMYALNPVRGGEGEWSFGGGGEGRWLCTWIVVEEAAPWAGHRRLVEARDKEDEE